MMGKYLYVDTSVLVSWATLDSEREKMLDWKGRFEKMGTSEIAVVECQAGVTWQIENKLTDDQKTRAEQNLNRILMMTDLYAIDSIVLGSARHLVKRYRVLKGLRTLDAIHLATALLIHQSLQGTGTEFEYLTADRRQHEAFTAEGFVGNLI